MLQGREMAQSLRNRARYLQERNMGDSASLCADAAEEIDRLLAVIRTRDKHITELQGEIFLRDGSDQTKLQAFQHAVNTAVAPLRAFVRQNSMQTVVDDWPFGYAKSPKHIYLRDLRAIAALYDWRPDNQASNQSKDG